MSTCPAFDVWGGYVLRCILAAGHSGDHLASDLEPVEPAGGPEQPPSVPAVLGAVASPTATAASPAPTTVRRPYRHEEPR